MLSQLTWDQFLDWMVVYKRNPWGPIRDDLRQEVNKERLLASLFGAKAGHEIPDFTFPYVKPKMTREEELALREKTEAALEWNEATKRYEWKK